MFVLRGLSPDAQSVLAKIQMLCQQEKPTEERPESCSFPARLAQSPNRFPDRATAEELAHLTLCWGDTRKVFAVCDLPSGTKSGRS